MQSAIDFNLPGASIASEGRVRAIANQELKPAATKRLHMLDRDGLITHTAMFRPAVDRSPAWEHHIQTIAFGQGRFQVLAHTGRHGSTLRQHKQAGGPVSADMAHTMHEELVHGCLDNGLHPLSVAEIVQLQMSLCTYRLGPLSAHVTLAGRLVSLEQYLSLCGNMDDEQVAQLAAAKSRAILSNIARKSQESLSAVSIDDAPAIAQIMESARESVAFQGFGLELAPARAVASLCQD